jgi:hypothetical protein
MAFNPDAHQQMGGRSGREGAVWDRHRLEEDPTPRDKQVLVRRVIAAKDTTNELRAPDISEGCPCQLDLQLRQPACRLFIG